MAPCTTENTNVERFMIITSFTPYSEHIMTAKDGKAVGYIKCSWMVRTWQTEM